MASLVVVESTLCTLRCLFDGSLHLTRWKLF